jgi:hypothetical protein
MDNLVYCRGEMAKEVRVILFLERTWLFWWTIATVVILRWLHVISCNTNQEALGVRDADEEETPSDVDAVLSRKRNPPEFGRKHAY